MDSLGAVFALGSFEGLPPWMSGAALPPVASTG